MNKWRNPALQTITNHYKPLQTSTNLWKCWCWRVRSGRISETARRHQTSSPSARPMRCSCNPCNLPTLFQNIQNSFNHLIHLIPRVCRVCVTPQLLGYVEDGGRYDAKPNVHAMWCTTSLDIPHYTDVHRCCMLLHATQSYLCLARSQHCLAAQPAEQLQYRNPMESWKVPDWSMRRGSHLQASWARQGRDLFQLISILSIDICALRSQSPKW